MGGRTCFDGRGHLHCRGRLWTRQLSSSNRLVGVFTGIAIYAESTKCDTSCADRKSVWLNPGSARNLQARVLHELGHSVGDLASRNSYIGPDSSNKPSSLGTAGWGYSEAIPRGSALNEAFATFVGSTALMSDNTSVPLQCNSSVNCANNVNSNMETKVAECDVNNSRRHNDVIKFLWDLWDDGDSVDVNIAQFPDAMEEFSNGRGNNQKSEHWSCFGWVCWVSDLNERSVWDWNFNFVRDTSEDTDAVRAMNCL
jgi:hypothetical protein